VFIAGGLPLSPSPERGQDMTIELRAAEKSGDLLLSPLQEKEQDIVMERNSTPDTGMNKNESIDSRIFSFDPDCFSAARISIPTVHIIGLNDPWAKYSRSLVRLCLADSSKVHFHNGAHDVPRSDAALRQCAEQIEAAIGMAHLSRW
jgi:hypothetical protein